MAAHPDVDRSLELIRATTRRLSETLSALQPEAWDRPTTCPPWTVRQLVAHVIISGRSFKTSVERGVRGVTEPAAPEGGRDAEIDRVAAAPPAELLAALEAVTAEVEQLYEGLSAEQLEAICYHRRGNRPARWYVQHRLAEVAFHLWDLESSFGQTAGLDPEVARFLLPMLLESNAPRIYQVGPRGEGRFRLELDEEPGAAWLLTATPQALEVTRDGAAADVTIVGSAERLALLIYGRAALDDEEQRGRVRIQGDREVAARFHHLFRGP